MHATCMLHDMHVTCIQLFRIKNCFPKCSIVIDVHVHVYIDGVGSAYVLIPRDSERIPI
jgi:hypothetical protein